MRSQVDPVALSAAARAAGAFCEAVVEGLRGCFYDLGLSI